MSGMRNYAICVRVLVCVLALLFAAAPAIAQGTGAEKIEKARGLLGEIKKYDFGDSRVALTSFSELLVSVMDSRSVLSQFETEIITALGSDATFAGKQFLCQELSIIGTASSIPALMELMKDEKTADIALFTLERIPGSEVNTALVNALGSASGKVKIGIINTLGQRNDRSSVGSLGACLRDADPKIVESAAAALGIIGGDEAAAVLEKAKEEISGEVRDYILDAYLKCADGLLRSGGAQKALSMYNEAYAPGNPLNIRTAALKGILLADKQNAARVIIDTFRSGEAALEAAAVSAIRELIATLNTQQILSELPNFSAMGQIQFLSVFAELNVKSARGASLEAASHAEAAVRIEALKALARLGSEEDVAEIARIAAESDGIERETAREALRLLPGAAVDKKIVALIPGAAPKTKTELLASVGLRNIPESENVLLNAAGDSDPAVRRESLKALALVAKPEFLPALLQILIQEQNSGVRTEAERTVVAVAQKTRDERAGAKPVLDILGTVEKNDARVSLLYVLGRLGDTSALPELRKSLKDENAEYRAAAIRALALWPSPEPLEDLLGVARSATDETHKILALRGVIDLLKVENKRSVEQTVSLYFAAMDLATELNEKRMVLSGLANVPSMQAFEIAAQYLADPNLKPEAEVTVVSLVRRIEGGDRARIREILQQVADTTKNEALKSRLEDMLKRMSG